MKLGCHVSIAGGVFNAVTHAKESGCETFQIFTQNQRQWKSVSLSDIDVESFHRMRDNEGFRSARLLSHASYLINMCAQETDKLKRSRKAFVEELKRCDQLNLDYLVIHPGAHGGRGEEWGIAVIAETLNIVLSQYQPNVEILLETTAGQGFSIGYRFEHLQKIIEQVEKSSGVAVCIDTCHIFAAGYPIKNEVDWQNTFTQIEQTFCMDKLKALHLNDSFKESGSRKDRHAPIGEGLIGIECFEYLVNCEKIEALPAILEIPGGLDKFKQNISLLKSLRE